MVVEPILIQTNKPLPTVVSKQNLMLVEPMLMKFYKTGRCKPVNQPLDTVTTKARFLLVECQFGREVAQLDIRTRMLQPHELAAAHSFPKNYKFTGTKEDQTKQIGNSVPVKLAEAHAYSLLA